MGNVKCDQQFGNNLTQADSSDNYNKIDLMNGMSEIITGLASVESTLKRE